MHNSDHLQIAVDIAREAGVVLLDYFESDRVGTRAKGERDVVTAADLASERLVIRRLREAFPLDGIVGEEGSSINSQAQRRWYVDPLDGTLNYSRGIPLWSVSLALFDGDQPVLGVVHDPLLAETFRAASGEGSWRNDTRLAVSNVVKPEDAVVHITVDFHDHSMREGLEDLEAVAPHVLRTRNLGSAALALAYVAAGRLDAMLHRFAHPWDYGGGVVLVREAGGQVSSLHGRPYNVHSHTILAASSLELRDGLLGRLRRTGSGQLE